MKNDIETIILDNLIDDINNGIYKANDKLPSENELADLYYVPRIKVRKACERLEEMGYIYSEQGRGRYLKDRQQQIELVLSGKESFSKKMLDKGYDLITTNICCESIKFNDDIYKELGVTKKDEVYKIVRLRIVTSRPIAIHISYVASSVFKDIKEEGKSITSMFEYYQRKGYKEFASGKSIISISFPTAEERKVLECANLVPLLTLETNCLDASTQKVLEYTKIMYRSDSFKYIV